MYDMRRGTYRVPGIERVFILPADAEALDAAWDAYYAERGDTTPMDAVTDIEPRVGQAHESTPESRARKAAHDEAMDYVARYVGTWAFIKDLRADRRWGTKYMRLSDRQVEVVLASKQREAAWAAERAAKPAPAQTGINLTDLPIGRTYAAVENDSDGITFMVIDHIGDTDRFGNPSKWAGWVFVKQQVSDDLTKMGSQRPGQTYTGMWPTLVQKVLDDPMGAVARYGLELGKCGVCGRTLTDEESRRDGIGPVCKAKLAAGF